MIEPPPLEQAPDRVAGRRLVALAGLALCVAALGVVISWWMLRRDPASHPPMRAAARAAFRPGTPEQTPIEASERGILLKAEQRKQLATYGWVDRDAGVARIPIERAMDLRAQGLR